MTRVLLFCLVVFTWAAGALAGEGADPFSRSWPDQAWKAKLGQLAIQSGGRVKPFDTFAREGAELLTGKAGFRNLDAVEMIFSLAVEPQAWQNVKFIQVGGGLDRQVQLKRDLGLSEKESLFTPDELTHSPRLMPLFQELDAKQRAQEKLNSYYQALQRIGNQLTFLQELISGRALRFVPPGSALAQKSDAWLGFEGYTDELKLRFALMAAGFTTPKEEVRGKLGDYAEKFGELARAQNTALYPSERRLAMESHFNHLHPFRWSWVLTLCAALAMTVAFYNARPVFYAGAMGLYLAAFLLQGYGFGLRCWIAGRPPVSNMYESVLWVSFGCLLFGLVLELIYRKRVIALGSLIFATIALIIADNVGGVLDNGIHPLEPVLRSNYWLTIHVLTITLGYAAFALSLILGNLGLGQYALFGHESPKLPLRQLSFYAYRAVQVGVIFLAAGTILGGVWADYSWGRFWGWDPKETWALIALLGYVALIHARFRGMVKPFGFLSGCVAAFMGVLMAWYGVNFVLGVGLHSYGFSSGGVSYVATYCTAQFAFLGWAAWARKRELREKSAPELGGNEAGLKA